MERAITLKNNNCEHFKVNGQRLKLFYEPFHSSEVFDKISLVDFNSTHLMPANKVYAPKNHLTYDMDGPPDKAGGQTCPEGGGRP